MKAVVFEHHGDLDRLEWRDWPEPKCGHLDVKIRVEASAFNGFDPMVLQGIPTLKTPLPMIPGGDLAGTIVEVGSDVPKNVWQSGDRVLVNPLQPGQGLMGETLHGGFREYAVVPHHYVVRIPDNVSFEDATALPIAYGTAHRMLKVRGQVQKGDNVLVLGATGGVGVACVQLCSLMGARVTGCTSSASKGDALRKIGAQHVINTSESDFVEEAIKLYGRPRVFGEGGGADVVVNFIGGATWAKALRTARRGGKVLTCGATDGFDPATDLRYLWSLELNVLGSNGWGQDDILALLGLVSSGALKPVIHAVRKMSAAREAMQEFIDRKVFGKLILKP